MVVFSSFASVFNFAQPMATKLTVDYIQHGQDRGLSSIACYIIMFNVVQNTVSRLLALHDSAYSGIALAKAKCVLDTIVFEKMNTMSMAANKEVKIVGMLTRDTVHVRRLLMEITQTIHTVVNLLGIVSFFILNFGWTFAAILLIVFVQNALQE